MVDIIRSVGRCREALGVAARRWALQHVKCAACRTRQLCCVPRKRPDARHRVMSVKRLGGPSDPWVRDNTNMSKKEKLLSRIQRGKENASKIVSKLSLLNGGSCYMSRRPGVGKI
jgi:hypothetical protein